MRKANLPFSFLLGSYRKICCFQYEKSRLLRCFKYKSRFIYFCFHCTSCRVQPLQRRFLVPGKIIGRYIPCCDAAHFPDLSPFPFHRFDSFVLTPHKLSLFCLIPFPFLTKNMQIQHQCMYHTSSPNSCKIREISIASCGRLFLQ